MTAFPLPPVTQWRVRVTRAGVDVREELVNRFDDLSVVVPRMIDAGVEAEADDVVVEGRRRMNDYVGPPRWSAWERVQA